MRRVVISGIGALSALGSTVDALWQGLLGARSGIGRVPRLCFGSARVTCGGEVAELGPERENRDEVLANRAIDQALEQAGCDAREASFFWSTGLDTLRFSGRRARPRTAGACFNSLARRFARPHRMLAVACASGTQSLGDAFHLVRSGRADACVAGGSSAMLTVHYVVGFDALGALAVDRDGEDPADACKPFDQRRRGFALSDGAAALVIESRDRALARGASPLAEIRGFGTSQDAFDLNRPPEDGSGAELCIRRTLADAGLAPEEIGAINAHGTGTLAGDLAEAAALRRVFGTEVPVHGIKGAVGHAMAAAGALEAVVAVQSCASGRLPPTRNLELPDKRCELDLVRGEARRFELRRVLSTSFGMGGQNAALIVERSE